MQRIAKVPRRKRKKKRKEIWLFLDEFNTSPDIGWFNELICNHSLDGVALPDGIKIIAACNPYRERRLNQKEKDWFGGDSLAKYVYRVSPLCEGVKLHLWQFGSLPSSDERQYISEMVKERKNALNPSVQEFFEKELITITDQLCISQEFLRQKLHDAAVVSLRDVERCLTFFIWISNHFYKQIAVSKQIQYSLA
ncbi:hypothetical protein RFI_19493, partial [Reticulomyxa filosa]